MKIFSTTIFLLHILSIPLHAFAQEPLNKSNSLEISDSVAVTPKSQDSAIKSRIARILSATGWFEDVVVEVNEGVVTLSGTAIDDKKMDWAFKLAQKTEDVVAVVNQLNIKEPDLLDFSPLKNELRKLTRLVVNKAPLVILGLLLIGITWLLAIGTKKMSTSILKNKVSSPLLRDVLVKVTIIPVLIVGLYLFLSVSGLTSLAMTLLGGTGLLGLVIGFAFKDIAENFLASILISAQNPFAKGDLISLAGYDGYVQSVNMRSTLLMTLDGNHVQIPNAKVYKEVIVNQTANPNIRLSFKVGIGFDDSIAKAQAIALKVLEGHKATLADPEPLVLVDALGSATVILQIYFWIDITQYSQFKVRSALIRLVKVAFEESGISMPDEAREIIFPNGVPVQIFDEKTKFQTAKEEPNKHAPTGNEYTTNQAEGRLEADSITMIDQAKKSRLPEAGKNILTE